MSMWRRQEWKESLYEIYSSHFVIWQDTCRVRNDLNSVYCPFLFEGIKELDQVIVVLFTTHMFIGGFFGFILDNTIPGMCFCVLFTLNDRKRTKSSLAADSLFQELTKSGASRVGRTRCKRNAKTCVTNLAMIFLSATVSWNGINVFSICPSSLHSRPPNRGHPSNEARGLALKLAYWPY